MALFGYDESDNQGNIDNRVVPGSFDIIKATEGVGYTDPNCDANYQQAKSAGKLLGVYHFARPDGNAAVTEANWFVSQIQGYLGEAVLVLDFETNPMTVEWAKQWLDRVYELTKVRPWIYMTQSTANSMDWSSVMPNYAIWLAEWGANLPTSGYNPPNLVPTVNGNWTIVGWQFTSRGTLSGWGSPLDLDEMYVDAEGWHKYAEGDRNQPATTPAPAEPVTPVITPTPEPVPATPVEPVSPVAPAEPIPTPAPVVIPVATPTATVVATKPSLARRIVTSLSFLAVVAQLSQVKAFLKVVLSGKKPLGRIVRTAIQVLAGVVTFAYLVVTIPGFDQFWTSSVGAAIAAPSTIIVFVTALWNGIEAVVAYVQGLGD